MKKTALVFPGQGSQYMEMGKKLCDEFKIARETFEEANDALGIDLYKLCAEASIEELTKTENAQPAILTTSVAAFRAYMEEIAIEPMYCAGHSLGELSALACANAMSFSDAVKIVRKRGELMSSAPIQEEYAMYAVNGVSRNLVEDKLQSDFSTEKIVVISNYNAPDQVVISGIKSAVIDVTDKLKLCEAMIIPLKVSAPFHSPFMQSAAEKFREFLNECKFHELKYPVISNVTGMPYTGTDTIIENLTMQIVKPVKWQETMEYLNNKGIEMIVEIGPKTVLRNLSKKNIPSMNALSFDYEQDRETLRKIALAVDTVKGSNLSFISRCLEIAVSVLNRNWDMNDYQKNVIEPFVRMKEILKKLEQEGKEASIEQMYDALEMLHSVFITKHTPIEERLEKTNKLFDDTNTKILFSDFKVI